MSALTADQRGAIVQVAPDPIGLRGLLRLRRVQRIAALCHRQLLPMLQVRMHETWESTEGLLLIRTPFTAPKSTKPY